MPYYLSGLAANWEIGVLILGIALITLEVFVIPGFGITGIGGIIAVVCSLIFIMVSNDNFNFDFVPSKEIRQAAVVVLLGIFSSIIMLFIFGYRFTSSKMFNRVALVTEQKSDEGYIATFYKEDLIGKEGEAVTILRPSGRVKIDDEIYDAYTRGEYIERGEK